MNSCAKNVKKAQKTAKSYKMAPSLHQINSPDTNKNMAPTPPSNSLRIPGIPIFPIVLPAPAVVQQNLSVNSPSKDELAGAAVLTSLTSPSHQTSPSPQALELQNDSSTTSPTDTNESVEGTASETNLGKTEYSFLAFICLCKYNISFY